jgi:hypothetical protein
MQVASDCHPPYFTMTKLLERFLNAPNANRTASGPARGCTGGQKLFLDNVFSALNVGPTSCIAVEKMKSYSEIDTDLEVSVHQNLGKKKRVSRVVFGAGVFLIAAICGFALLTAIGQSQPCQTVVVILARIIIRIAWIFTITELMCFYFSFWHYLRRRFWLHAQF